jgi:FecR-like protein
MRHNRRVRVGFLSLACVVVMIATARTQQTSPIPTSAPYAGATISDFKGTVKLQGPAEGPFSPKRGLALPPATIVSTEEGRILLHLQDGSEVLVRPHTRVMLTTPTGSDWRYLQLIIGRIRTEVQKRMGGTPPFQIGTPSAVISVRGTRFLVEVNRHNVTQVDVQEGLVEIQSVSGLGSPVFIGPGFSARVGENSAPEPARPTRELRPDLERPDRGGDKESDSEREDRAEAGAKEDREHDQLQDFDEPGEGKPSSNPAQPGQEGEPTSPDSA